MGRSEAESNRMSRPIAQKPLAITLAGICLAGILVSASFWISRTLTGRFVGFRDDYLVQQAFAAAREVLQFDLEMVRFARSIPMREEAIQYLMSGAKASLDPLLDSASARSYHFDFAMVFQNGVDFSVGYQFDDDRRQEIDDGDPFVTVISKALDEREIVRPTGFVAKYDKALCFIFALPLRGRDIDARIARSSGVVLGRWLSQEKALSANYPEFTVRLLLESDFDWPEDLIPFDVATLFQKGRPFEMPFELMEDDRGGPGRPARRGPRGPRSGRGEGFPPFMEDHRPVHNELPAAILAGVNYNLAEVGRLDREGMVRTLLCGRVEGLLADESVVVEMLLPRELTNAVMDSIQLVRWTSAGIALLICVFTGAVFNEIHRRRVAEVELVVSNDELREANEKKDRLLSIIAHDLRAPLSGVVNLAGLMLKAPESFTPVEIREFAVEIQTTSKRLTELLENLLNWARLQIGRLPYVPAALDVSKMVHQVVLLFESTARLKDVELGLEVADGLVIVGDQEMLRTILRNLIGNAVQYTCEGGLVVVSAELSGEFVAIRIKDSGPGLSAEKIETLFELPSKPLLNEGDGSRGAGFGLILCRELVERLEGHLAVDSQVGEGTVFTVCIPARLEVASAARRSPEGAVIQEQE